MDKKKVIELIKEAQHLAFLRKCENRRAYLNNCIRCLKEALEELSKSDWISVDERLPEYGEKVCVYSKYKGLYWISHRMKDVCIKKDNNGFIRPLKDCAITHWKPIEKLEE